MKVVIAKHFESLADVMISRRGGGQSLTFARA